MKSKLTAGSNSRHELMEHVHIMIGSEIKMGWFQKAWACFITMTRFYDIPLGRILYTLDDMFDTARQ